jgi:methylated-DNA-[protein]-cysteine S-methyltransferase
MSWSPSDSTGVPADGGGDAHFTTAVGWMSVAWRAGAVAGVRLLGSSVVVPSAEVTALPTPPPHAVLVVMRRITGLLAGELNDDLRDVQVDMSGLSSFDRRVYDVLRGVTPGSTITYGELSRLAGRPTAARVVGRVLARNPFPIVVPCHRVVAASGAIGGFSAPGGTTTKMRLLDIERRWAPPAAGQMTLSLR